MIYVNVYYEYDNGQLIFSVADKGNGMKPEDQKKIFKLFKTMDNYLDPNKFIVKDGGTIGMGIIISKMIIEKFGGKLDFSSEF